MKNNFNDKQLELAAKNIVEGIARQCYIEPDEKPADNTISIKLAKAKAGARRHINRTIRICAVAAVLMVGLVCALFMGAKEDEPKPINLSIVMDAYMWKNNDSESADNMPVKVRFNLYQTEVIYSNEINEKGISKEVRSGAIVEGNIIIENLDGEIIKEFNNLRLTKDEIHKNYNTELPISLSHVEREYTKNNGMDDKWVIDIDFNEDFTSFEIFIDNTFEPYLDDLGLEVHITEDGGVWSHRDATFITSGASNREEAVARRYEIAELYYQKEMDEKGYSYFNYDRIKNHAWN